MLFASDLDRTLIYSPRTFEGEEWKEKVCSVEIYENKPISFMTKNALRMLKELSKRLLFVPVTTRTKLQYRRIHLFQNEIIPKYAVTGNGGTIFINNQEDEGWNSHIKSLSSDTMLLEDIINRFNEIRNDSWVATTSGKVADGLFYYCIVDREKIPDRELQDFTEWAKQQNWDVSLQGRKLYLVPNYVSKRNAVAYIKENEGVSRVIAAGDSLLDLSMLKYANQGIVPQHGELYSLYVHGLIDLSFLHITTSSGIVSAEEILTIMLKLCDLNVENCGNTIISA
ncbi:MAG: HAD family hydrolase [Desulfitobacteriaceae bacterium]